VSIRNKSNSAGESPAPPHNWVEHLDKGDLHELADGLLAGEGEAIDRCMDFVLAETRGLWHGRARAMMCRRLKHCSLTAKHRELLVPCILNRLATGNFSEQFRDQLRLALHLDRESTLQHARECVAGGSKEHVQRLAQWVLRH